MFSVHAMVGGGQSTAARSAQVEVILELSRDVFFRSRMFFPTPPHAQPPPPHSYRQMPGVWYLNDPMTVFIGHI